LPSQITAQGSEQNNSTIQIEVPAFFG